MRAIGKMLRSQNTEHNHNRFKWGQWLAGLALVFPLTLSFGQFPAAYSQNSSRSITLRADIQEANARTGVLTARGNVQILYPARNIQATAAQAQYFSRERRIVLSGNVYVLQEGNSLRGETVTYLIDEGRFVALPQAQGQQVEAIYIVPESTNSPGSPAPLPATPEL